MRCPDPSTLCELLLLTRYRYHIGESLIPSVRHFLRFVDAEQKLVEYGFKHKVRQSVCWSVRNVGADDVSDVFIARCSSQVQSVQAGGMYVTHV